MPRTVITFGTFDVFHYGHLRILERARAEGDRLVVGVSSDALNYRKKAVYPAIKQEQRLAIVKSLQCVDEVFFEEALELKAQYCRDFKADLLIMGDDHDKEYDVMLKGICDTMYLPRTKEISSTTIKKNISENSLPKSSPNTSTGSLTDLGMNIDAKDSPLKTTTPATYSAANKNLVHSTTQSNPVTGFLIYAHDRYYDLIMTLCTPFCRVMPRSVGGVTIFTANIVTYGRGLLTPVIVFCMKYGYLKWAAFLVMYHDFLDHLDGVVAKQQARDGRSKGDDGAFGAFLDAQMDKLVFCMCLWSFLVLVDYSSLTPNVSSSDLIIMTILVLTSVCLFALEATIAAVRTSDYFCAKYSPPTEKGAPALRAVSEGKLKQKFESLGIAMYCMTLPNPVENFNWMVAGTTCLWFAIYFSTQSLAHKLRARAKGKSQ